MKDKLKDVAKSKSLKKDFDFEYWRDLAKKDPEAFEIARKQELDRSIRLLGNAETQEKLTRLQWRIDMERKRCKSPMESAVRMYDMMWESVGKNFGAMQDLANQLKPDADRKSTRLKSAKVLSFKKDDVAM